MTRIMFAAMAAVLAGSLALLAQTADPPATEEIDLTEVPALGPGLIALQIREGDIVIDRKRTIEMGGRFHSIHTRYMAMSCASCHTGLEYPEGVQFLRRDEFPLDHPDHPGVVDRAVCIACHSGEHAIATPIYGVDPE